MKNIKLMTVLLITGVMVTGCSKPQDAVIPKDMSTWDSELKPKVEKLSDEEKQIFARYMIRVKMAEAFGGSGMPEGTTIGLAIQEQKDFEAKQKAKEQEQAALKAKAEAQQKAAIDEMNSVLTFAMLSKEHREIEYQEYMLTKISFENKSKKDVSGVKGLIKVSDMFGDKIIDLGVSYDSEILAGNIVTDTLSFNYNQFMADHKNFMGGDLNKMKVVFVPETILFKDGTKLDMPK